MDFHQWFQLLFTPFFLLFPLLVTLCVRAREDGDPATYRKRLTRLVAATVASVGLFAGLRALGHAEFASRIWPLLFVLWFPLAMPAIVAKNPAWGPTPPPGRTTRTATLVDRQEEVPDLRWWRVVTWAVWGIALVVILLRLVRPMEGAETTRFAIAVCMTVLMLVWPPMLIPWVARRVHEEPEPLDATGSDSLRRAYREHRRRRTVGFAVMLLGMTLLLGAGMAALAWVPAGSEVDRMLGWILGGAGALVGLAGGAFGTWMSFERARIAGILRDLEAHEPADA